jgi:hypothetical protein
MRYIWNELKKRTFVIPSKLATDVDKEITLSKPLYIKMINSVINNMITPSKHLNRLTRKMKEKYKTD